MDTQRTGRFSIGWLALLAPLWCACEGQGSGQVDGTLFLRGCSQQGTLDFSPVPATLPPFRLDPTFFAGEPTTMQPPTRDEDVRGANTLSLRVQRDANRYERTDGVLFVINDVDALLGQIGRPLPLLTAPLSGASVPLPGPVVGVMAAIYLHGTCPFARVQPYLSGSITFSALGYKQGDRVAATFSATVLDPRAARAGQAASERDVAGDLRGDFSLEVIGGRASVNY